MNRLTDHFDLIIVISLPERKDRRDALRRNLAETGLATESDIHWMDACGPEHAGGPPTGWTACRPAWGCLQSHLAAYDLAMERGARAVCILEDDAYFSPRSPKLLQAFMQAVPPDWAQIYLGGCHAREPHPTSHPLVWKAGGVTATHAYAVAAHSLPAVRRRMADPTDYVRYAGWHCDSQLAYSHLQEHWPVYAPSWWLAAQAESRSDINGEVWPRRWHHRSSWSMDLPFVLLRDRSALSPEEAAAVNIPDQPPPASIPALLEWMDAAARESMVRGTLPAVTSQAVSASILNRLWPRGIVHHPGVDLPVMADYPFNGLFLHPFTAAVAALS